MFLHQKFRNVEEIRRIHDSCFGKKLLKDFRIEQARYFNVFRIEKKITIICSFLMRLKGVRNSDSRGNTCGSGD